MPDCACVEDFADLEKSDTILESHITEAVRFRSVDRKYWGVETI